MDTEKYKKSEHDVVLEVLVDYPTLKHVRVMRGGKELVVIDILPPFSEGFQPESQVQISGISSGNLCYEIWIDGEYFHNYGSK